MLLLQGLEGVEKVDVNLETGVAQVEVMAQDPLDAAFNQLPKMVEIVKGLGFEAEPHFEDCYE